MASTLRMRTTRSTPVAGNYGQLFRPHQHGIATREMSHIRSLTPPVTTEAEPPLPLPPPPPLPTPRY